MSSLITPVREPVIVHYDFFVTAIYEGVRERTLASDEFRQELAHAIGNFYTACDAPTPSTSLAPWSERDGTLWPDSPALKGWQDGASGIACRVTCRLVDSTLVLQRAMGYKGRTLTKANEWREFQSLMPQIPARLAENDCYLGHWTACGGIADQTALDEVDATTEFVRRILEADRPSRMIRQMTLDTQVRLMDVRGVPNRFVLLHSQSAEESGRTGEIYDEFLTKVGLLLCKTSRLAGSSYRERDRRLLLQKERTLVEAMERARIVDAGAVIDLERQLHAVAQAFNSFIGVYSAFQQVRNTTKLNQAKLTNVLSEWVPRIEGPAVAWTASVASAVDQLEADHAYFDATLREADLTLRAVQAQAEVLRLHQEQRENELLESRNSRLNQLMIWLAIFGSIIALESDDAILRIMAQRDTSLKTTLTGLDALSGVQLILWKIAVAVLLAAAFYGLFYGGRRLLTHISSSRIARRTRGRVR